MHAATTALLAATTVLFAWSALRGSAGETAARGGVVSFVLPVPLDAVIPPIVGSDGSIVVPRPRPALGLDVLRPGALAFVPLDGTEGVMGAGFSPEADWLAFQQPMGAQAGVALRRMPSGGGPISTLWQSTVPFLFSGGVAWGDDGWIYIAVDALLGRVPEEGGPLDTLAMLGSGFVSNPAALPGGGGVVFTLWLSNTSPDNRVVLLNTATRDTVTVVRDGFDARWVDSGHLVYAHSGGALYALPFDPRRLEPTGPPVPVVDDAAVFANVGGRFTVSPNGTLVFAQGTLRGAQRTFSFALVGPTGQVDALRLDATDHPDAALSPDGSRLAYTRDLHIWIYDLDRGTNRQLTDEGENHHNPIWSPDGTEVVFTSARPESPTGDLYGRAADGSSPARRIGGRPDFPDYATQWLEDGRILLFDALAASDIYSISATGDAPPEALLEADWSESAPRVSPDGRWLAYASTEDGDVPHLFVRRWPDLGGKTQLTSGSPGISQGDNGLVWSADSRTLFFLRGLRLWTATLTGEAPSFALRDTEVDVPGPLWDRHPDGRLLVHVSDADSARRGRGSRSAAGRGDELVTRARGALGLGQREVSGVASAA